MMLSSIICGLIILLHRCLLSHTTNKTRLDEPLNIFNMSAKNLDSNSKYRAQMDFIHNYLLHFKQPGDHLNNHENATKVYGIEITKETLANVTADNNTTNTHQIKTVNGKNGNNISTNLLPVIYSYRGETLPTHPRIPRKTPRRRTRLSKQQLRQRRNKHGTRVFLLKPARYLLPPLVTHRIEDIPALSYATVATTFSTEKNNSRNHLQFKENRSLDDRQILNSTFSRKVFIPPPLRYLLPPLYDENDFGYQTSTTENIPPITTLNNPNSDREDVEQYRSQPELQDQSKENHNVFRIFEPNIEILQEESTSTLGPTQEDIIHTLSENYTTEDYIFSQSEADVDEENPVDKEYPKNRYSAENPITGFENLLNTTIEERNLNIDTNNNRAKAYPNQSITSDSREIYVTSQDITQYQNETTTPFPFITGRNIEKELFESGQFQHFDRTTEPTTETHREIHNDFKLSMFNKPLLSAEVEKAGMKIFISNQNSTHIKKWEDVRHSSRGRYKYNHFNQFRFDNRDDRHITTSRPISVESKGRGRSLQLSVAETNYYNKRRISKQQELDQREVRVIPGIPGKDYPTLTKPPTTRNFSCKNLAGGRGYYGDTSTGCQVFYVCVGGGPGEPMLCPNGTLFSQDFLVCDWWYNVDCRENV